MFIIFLMLSNSSHCILEVIFFIITFCFCAFEVIFVLKIEIFACSNVDIIFSGFVEVS